MKKSFLGIAGLALLGPAVVLSTATEKDMRKINIAGKEYTLTARRAAAEFPTPEVEQSCHGKTLLWYQRGDPRDVYPDSVPRQDELKTELSTFAAKDQYADACFSLYAVKNLKGVKIELEDDLRNENGTVLSRTNIDLKTVKFRMHKNAWEGAESVHTVPELLEEPAEIDEFEAKSSQSFWLQTKNRIPTDCLPGNYTGSVNVVFNQSQSLKIPVRIRVLPFELKTPDVTNNFWSMYIICQGLSTASVEQLNDEYRHLGDYGFKGIITRIYRDAPYNFVIKDGKIVEFESENLKRIQQARRNAGMNAPLALWWHNFLEQRVAKDTKTKLDFGNPEFRERMIEAFKAIDRAVKRYGGEEYGTWYYYGYDEPGDIEERFVQAYGEHELAALAGVPGADTCYGPSYARLRPVCRIQITPAWCREATSRENEPWWLIAGGVYAGQEGGLMPDRYLSGFQFFQSGAQAGVSWTYRSDYCGNPYDFSGEREIMIVYPPRNGRKTSTLQWEGIRKGVDDYRYLFTLEECIARCAAAGKKKPAEDARRQLHEVLALFPEKGNYTDDPVERKFDNELADKCRWLLAMEIMKLQQYSKNDHE